MSYILIAGGLEPPGPEDSNHPDFSTVGLEPHGPEDSNHPDFTAVHSLNFSIYGHLLRSTKKTCSDYLLLPSYSV